MATKKRRMTTVGTTKGDALATQAIKQVLGEAPKKPMRTRGKKIVTEEQPLGPLVVQTSAPLIKGSAPAVKKQISTLLPFNKERYSDDELAAFKEDIEARLIEEKGKLTLFKLTHGVTIDNGTDDTYSPFKGMEEGSETLSRDEVTIQLGRYEKFIKHLEDALLRIRNKTYGICRVTGRLISKERLRLVPHTTLSMEAKANMTT